MKKILSTDYRFEIPGIDNYGRRLCTFCGKLRKVNAYWKDTNGVLCKECSVKRDIALGMSLRSHHE